MKKFLFLFLRFTIRGAQFGFVPNSALFHPPESVHTQVREQMQWLIEHTHLLRPGRGTVTTTGVCAKCFILPSTQSIVFSFDPSKFPLVYNGFDQEYIASN